MMKMIQAAGSQFLEEVARWRISTLLSNLSKAGWSWGCVSALDREGRTIWMADPQRDDGKRFVARADEKLTAFLELESAIRRASVKISFLQNQA